MALAGAEQDVIVAGDFNVDFLGDDEAGAPLAAVCANGGLHRVLSAPHAAVRHRHEARGALGPLRHIDFVMARGG
eukprot:2063791-Alexandrium_andersonii.AAC.1